MRDLLFLLALPASGKSEIRRYLDHLDDEEAAALGLGRLVHLDDYPYVHLLRRISEEAAHRGAPGVVFPSPEEPFADPREWTALSLLLADDARIVVGKGAVPGSVVDRLDRFRRHAGLDAIPVGVRDDVIRAVAPEADAIAAHLRAAAEAWEPDHTTLVVEFARGGPEGAPLPLHPPYGNRHALACFGDLLERSRVLFVGVGADESLRRNRERARPGREGDASILHHGVPEEVMRLEYGTDDATWLLEASRVPGAIEIPVDGRVTIVPASALDNRDDLTSHLRGEPETWDPVRRAELHRRLVDALGGPPLRHRWVRALTSLPEPPPVDLEVRPPVVDDAQSLAVLMMEAYRGTIDFEDETLDDARAEVAGYFGGSPILAASRLALDGERVVAACLVGGRKGGVMVAYVMTAASHTRRGLATALAARSLAALAAAGWDDVQAWITEGNTASECLFARLGSAIDDDPDA